jgi:hypothetical protein
MLKMVVNNMKMKQLITFEDKQTFHLHWNEKQNLSFLLYVKKHTGKKGHTL